MEAFSLLKTRLSDWKLRTWWDHYHSVLRIIWFAANLNSLRIKIFAFLRITCDSQIRIYANHANHMIRMIRIFANHMIRIECESYANHMRIMCGLHMIRVWFAYDSHMIRKIANHMVPRESYDSHNSQVLRIMRIKIFACEYIRSESYANYMIRRTLLITDNW